MNLEYLSHSRLELFEQCPLAFSKKYGDDKPVDDGDGGEFSGMTNHYALHGTAIHRALELWGNRKMAGGDINEEELIEYLLSVYPPPQAFPQGKFVEYRDKALYTIRTFLLYNQDVVPLACEKTLLTKIDDDLPLFKMVIDRIDGPVESPSRHWDLTDYKSAKPYDKKKVESKYQLTIYDLGVERVHGDLPRVNWYYHVCHNHRIPIYPTPDRLQRDLDHIKGVYDKILAEKDWAGRYDWFFCNKICDFGFNKQCEFLKKQVTGGTTQKAAGLKWGNKII